MLWRWRGGDTGKADAVEGGGDRLRPGLVE